MADSASFSSSVGAGAGAGVDNGHIGGGASESKIGSPKGKRGRPRKNSAPASAARDDMDGSSSSAGAGAGASASPAPRKRGRPRKIPAYEHDVTVVESSEELALKQQISNADHEIRRLQDIQVESANTRKKVYADANKYLTKLGATTELISTNIDELSVADIRDMVKEEKMTQEQSERVLDFLQEYVTLTLDIRESARAEAEEKVKKDELQEKLEEIYDEIGRSIDAIEW